MGALQLRGGRGHVSNDAKMFETRRNVMRAIYVSGETAFAKGKWPIRRAVMYHDIASKPNFLYLTGSTMNVALVAALIAALWSPGCREER